MPAVAGPEIERLIQLLARLPGLGPRSARRAALHLIKKKEQLLAPLADAMSEAVDKVRICSVCGNVDTREPCSVCRDPARDPAILIVVEDVGDLWALERAGAMNARFHVLGGTLSPLDGIRHRSGQRRQQRLLLLDQMQRRPARRARPQPRHLGQELDQTLDLGTRDSLGHGRPRKRIGNSE